MMLRSKKTIEKLLIESIQSQQRVNEAIITDLGNLADKIHRLENYAQLIEARREADLKERRKKDD
jgi:hypothetical protein